jgi:hypothetical protein
MVTLAWVFGREFLKNNWNKPVKENSWQNLLPKITLKLSSENENLRHHELDSFLILKDLYQEIVGNVTMLGRYA